MIKYDEDDGCMLRPCFYIYQIYHLHHSSNCLNRDKDVRDDEDDSMTLLIVTDPVLYSNFNNHHPYQIHHLHHGTNCPGIKMIGKMKMMGIKPIR